MLRRTTSAGTCHSVIPRLREYREAQLVSNFFNVATPFSPKIQDWILSFRSQPELFYLQKSSTLKNRWFCVLCHNPHSPKLLENAIIIDKCRYSNWIFSATRELSSSIKSQMKNLSRVEEDSIGKPLIITLTSKSWWSKISRKLLKMIHLD